MKTNTLSLIIISALTIPLFSQGDGESGGIVIRAAATNYHGRCPVTVHFEATVYASGSRVRYYWERNRRNRTPTKTSVLERGKLTLHDDFAVGSPGLSFTATDRLHVQIDGAKWLSTPIAESTGTCSDANVGR